MVLQFLQIVDRGSKLEQRLEEDCAEIRADDSGTLVKGRDHMDSSRRFLSSLLLVVVLSACLKEVSAVTRAQDVAALKELYNTWSSVRSLNWKGDPCENLWTGVFCDKTNTSVTNLTLANRNLEGSLPPAIGGLTNLLALELSRNTGLGGPLPVELGKLTLLRTLSLQWCSFTGVLPPELGNLVNLYFVGLNGNKIGGQIPSTFGNLTSVFWLDISSNNLTGGIPVSSSPGSGGIGLNNMTAVRHFHFNNNSLSGPIPGEIFSLHNLLHLIVDHNQLSGSIPAEIGNSRTLTILRLDDNNFQDSFPQNITQVTTLFIVNLHNNDFSGVLPNLTSLTQLQSLDVSGNNWDVQDFPSWLSSLSHLLTLNLAQSGIKGQLPDGILNLPDLQSLNLSYNQINGTLQFTDDTAPSLSMLDLTHNGIVGFAGQPENQGQVLSNLTTLLEGNPLCLNGFLKVQKVSCGSNGTSNQWSSTATCSGVKCKDGKLLNPKSCTCAYPLEVRLEFTAPGLSYLTPSLASKVETEFATLLTSTGIISLDPKQVVIASGFHTDDIRYILNLQFFPLSGNRLSAAQVITIADALTQRSITLTEGPFQVPFLVFLEATVKDLLSAGAIAGIVVALSAVALLLIMFAVREKRRADKAVRSHPFASWGGDYAEFGDAPMLKGARWFSLGELKAATHNWSEDNEIGVGSYGKVYRGTLQTGDVVAIKRAREGSLQEAAEFKNEIEVLSRVHHRNLVGLLGFCYESGEQALIFEFMSNGTLREHLLGQRGYPKLTWQERLGVAVGSARGLAYLHEHANPTIIHANVKSANVLFSERNVAKVADFGLIKLMPSEVVTKGYSQSSKGTSGYLDPEYYNTQELTYKSDIYSFGIVLLELLTAKAPIENGKSIVNGIRKIIDKGGLTAVRSLLDPMLKDVISDGELEAFLKIALTCVENSSLDRQNMVEVVKDLEALEMHNSVNSSERKPEIDFAEKNFNDSFHDIDTFSTSVPLKPLKSAGDQTFQYSGAFGASTVVKPK